MSDFRAFFDSQGDLQISAGTVIVPRSGVRFEVGNAGQIFGDRTNQGVDELKAVQDSPRGQFVGGSGRNLIVAGPEGLAGFFQPREPGIYESGVFRLDATASPDASILDATDSIAVWDSGASAPLGSYVSTSYGESLFDGPFTVEITAEDGPSGPIPSALIQISAGTAQGGIYAPIDAVNYESVDDPNWTISIGSSGRAELRNNGEPVAVRPEGSRFNPAGRYEANEAGFALYVPEDATLEAGGRPPTNPFGILTITYSWSGSPDLDTGTSFLGSTVGYGFSGSSAYMAWTGDNTATGSESVIIDLASAWDAEEIDTFADIVAMADWYPPAGGAGPATITVNYSVGDTETTATIYPGNTATPASTIAASLRIEGSDVRILTGATWNAHVQRIPVPTRPGIAYIKLTETEGVLTAVEGPFFAQEIPENTAADFHFPLAESDGEGALRQIHEGPLSWYGTGGGGSGGGGGGTTTGLAWVSLTQAAYNALSEVDEDTIYDITDLVPIFL